MQHVRQHHVLQERGFAPNLALHVHAGHRLADYAVGNGWLGHGHTGGRHAEPSFGQEVPIVLPGSAPRVLHHAVGDCKLPLVALELFGRDGQQLVSELGRGLPQRSPGHLHGHAAGGGPFVEGGLRIRRVDADAGNVHIQFLRHHLGQGCGDPLSQFHLAGVHVHAAVRTQADPIVEIGVVCQRTGQRCAGLLGGRLQTVVGRDNPVDGLRLGSECNPLDGSDHPVVDAAPAQVAVDRVPDFSLRGFGVAVQKTLGRHQEAGHAVAALGGGLRNEGLLQWIQLSVRGQPLHRLYRTAGKLPHRPAAGGLILAVHKHLASTALLGAAGVLGPRQSQFAAQHLQQWGVGARRDPVGLTVDDEIDVVG